MNEGVAFGLCIAAVSLTLPGLPLPPSAGAQYVWVVCVGGGGGGRICGNRFSLQSTSIRPLTKHLMSSTRRIKMQISFPNPDILLDLDSDAMKSSGKRRSVRRGAE